MSCQFFNGVGTGCTCCTRFVKTTAVAVVGGNLQLTLPALVLHNHQRICVCIAQSIPGTVTPNMPVTILTGFPTLNVRNSCGNIIYADQVRSRTVLHLIIATDSLTAILSNEGCLCCSAHDYPVLNPDLISQMLEGGHTPEVESVAVMRADIPKGNTSDAMGALKNNSSITR